MSMKKNTGYTLIELMTVLAVVAVVLSVGVPQLSVYFQSNRMVSNTNNLVSALQIARSEAIKYNARATVCKSSDPTASPPVCIHDGLAGGWENGWFVFIDSDGVVGTYNASTDGPLLRVFAKADGSNVTITSHDVSINDFVSFTSRGVPKTASGAGQKGVFSICDQRGLNTGSAVFARGVEVSASGRVNFTDQVSKIVSCP